ncbi:MAG: DUF2313 domain-containing protein [Magnetospirillum sp.]|nr:DUF2313 domain-containing protein [Magnetospirillum sp.]
MDRVDRLTRQLMTLLPPGRLWPREPGTVRYTMMGAIAGELDAVIAFFEQILAERSPRTALHLLGDWENVLGLPDDCAGPAETIAERRRQAHAKMVATGGQCPAYFIEVAKALGFDIEIVQYRARWYGLRKFGQHYGGEDMQHTWKVVEKSGTIRPRKFGSAYCGEPFTTWGNRPLVCTIRRLAPAYTEVLFA